MKVAVLSDIHGNSIALDAVLADAAEQSVEAYWIVGDFAYSGIDPIGAIERIEALSSKICLLGNTDQRLLKGIRFEEARPKPITEADWQFQVDISRNVGWTFGMLWAAGQHHFLQALPQEYRLALPDGTRVLLVHASPSKIDGAGFRPSDSESEMKMRMHHANADLVFVGHTHWPMNQLVGNVHLVNLGCVGNQLAHWERAQYVILEADSTGYTVEHRYIAYDRAACVAYCKDNPFPGSDYVGFLARGEYRPKWLNSYTSAELDSLIPPANIKLPRPQP